MPEDESVLDEIDPQLLVHLLGYTAIVVTLGTAAWANLLAWLVVFGMSSLTMLVCGIWAAEKILRVAQSRARASPQRAPPSEADDA